MMNSVLYRRSRPVALRLLARSAGYTHYIGKNPHFLQSRRGISWNFSHLLAGDSLSDVLRGGGRRDGRAVRVGEEALADDLAEGQTPPVGRMHPEVLAESFRVQDQLLVA